MLLKHSFWQLHRNKEFPLPFSRPILNRCKLQRAVAPSFSLSVLNYASQGQLRYEDYELNVPVSMSCEESESALGVGDSCLFSAEDAQQLPWRLPAVLEGGDTSQLGCGSPRESRIGANWLSPELQGDPGQDTSPHSSTAKHHSQILCLMPEAHSSSLGAALSCTSWLWPKASYTI